VIKEPLRRVGLILLLAAGAVAADDDPRRPACTTAVCLRIHDFVKAHYCVDANGPGDSCRPGSDKAGKVKIEAGYDCTWVVNDRRCRQHGQPRVSQRDAAMANLRRLGLPVGAPGSVYFTSWKGSGWSLVEAYFSRVDGEELSACGVIFVQRAGSAPIVLREMPYVRTDVDSKDLTTWTPIDIVDVDGDGQPEFVLEGDAYEDHWLEVIQIANGKPRTVFSGLGYGL
jgi:hypothetical protein